MHWTVEQLNTPTSELGVSNLCAPTVNVLLFEDASISVNINKLFFCAVQKFILNSKRFKPNYDLTDSIISET